MSDLEEKGFLFHPHTSAGRIPTNKAYRVYVDSLLSFPPIKAVETDRLAEEITNPTGSSPIETILRRAAQTLGVLTQELGVALGPRLDLSVLRRLELVRVSSERLLMVLTLERRCDADGLRRDSWRDCRQRAHRSDGGAERTALRPYAAADSRVAVSAPARYATDPGSSELLNIFLQEGEQLFDAALPMPDTDVMLGAASVLAEQPEFSGADNSAGCLR